MMTVEEAVETIAEVVTLPATAATVTVGMGATVATTVTVGTGAAMVAATTVVVAVAVAVGVGVGGVEAMMIEGAEVTTLAEVEVTGATVAVMMIEGFRHYCVIRPFHDFIYIKCNFSLFSLYHYQRWLQR